MLKRANIYMQSIAQILREMIAKVIVLRTPSDRVAYGIRSGGERNLIGRRTQSDRAADGIRSGGVRVTMT